MAAGDHNPSRRALLGAAVGLPLLPRHCEERSDAAIQCGVGVSSGLLRSARNDGEWQAALAAVEAAQAAVWEIEAATAGYGLEDEEALLPAHEAACDAMEVALGRMLLAPAPDLAAFAAKLELFFEHELEPHSVGEDVLAAIRGDAARLAGMG
jgi:hypothetical protein